MIKKRIIPKLILSKSSKTGKGLYLRFQDLLQNLPGNAFLCDIGMCKYRTCLRQVQVIIFVTT